MASKLNSKCINLITEQLRALPGINDSNLSVVFEKTDFLLSLNFKLFSQISHFALQTIDKNLISKLPWPIVTPKQKDVFIRELVQAVNKVKERYDWAEIPICLKSHFQAPHSENDKVIEFILGLTTTALFVVNGTEGKGSLSELESEVANINTAISNYQQQTRRLHEETVSGIARNQLIRNKLRELKQELVREGVFASDEEVTLEELIQMKRRADRVLLEEICELQKIIGLPPQ